MKVNHWFTRVALVGALLVIASIVLAKHGQFPPELNAAFSQDGYPCCGKRDCLPLIDARVLASNGELSQIAANGVLGWIRTKSIVKLSLDHGYICLNEYATINCSLTEIRPECVRCFVPKEPPPEG